MKRSSAWLSIVIACGTLEASPCFRDRFPIEVNGSWGYVDTRGHIAVATRFDAAGEFPCSAPAVVRIGSTYRYVTRDGAYAFDGEFSHAEPFSEGLAFVEREGDRFFIDLAGNKKFALPYSYVQPFSGGRALVFENEKYGYVDRDGKLVIAAKYSEHATRFSEGLAAARRSIKLADNNRRVDFVFVTPDGEVRLDGYASADIFSEGVAAVKKTSDGSWEYIDQRGESAFRGTFADAAPFSEGFARVVQYIDGFPRYGFIDATGKQVIPTKFELAFGFSERVAAVKLGGRWGYVDTRGRFVVTPRFHAAAPMQEGLARVEWSDGTWGYINRRGRTLWRSSRRTTETTKTVGVVPANTGGM